MEYNWNIKEIERKLKLAKIFNNKYYKNFYSSLIELYQEEDITEYEDLCEESDYSKNDFYEAEKKFCILLGFIEEDLFNICRDIYKIFDDPDLLDNRIEFNKNTLTDDDIIEIVREIIKSLDNVDMLSYYDYLIKNHYLYIKKTDIINELTCSKLNGLTFFDKIFNKPYVILFKQNTIEDIETLFHEFFHAYFFHLIKFRRNYIQRLHEVEGIAATIYCHNYLEKNGFMEIDKLRKETFASNIIESFKIMINTLLIKNNYDVDKVNEILLSTLKNEFTLNKTYLSTILYIDGFKTTSDILSYLVALDLVNNTRSPQEFFNDLYNIKSHDNLAIKKNIKEVSSITFYKDNLANLKKERKLTIK